MSFLLNTPHPDSRFANILSQHANILCVSVVCSVFECVAFIYMYIHKYTYIYVCV